MALPLLQTVSSLVRVNWPFIRQGVARNMSSNAIIGALRTAGQAGRRSDLLRTIRYAREQKAYGERLQTTSPTAIPTRRDIPLAPHKIRREFSYLINIVGTDIDTGQTVTRQVTIATNSILSKAVASQMALDTIEDDEDRYGTEDATASVSNIMQAGVSGRF